MDNGSWTAPYGNKRNEGSYATATIGKDVNRQHTTVSTGIMVNRPCPTFNTTGIKYSCTTQNGKDEMNVHEQHPSSTTGIKFHGQNHTANAVIKVNERIMRYKLG